MASFFEHPQLNSTAEEIAHLHQEVKKEEALRKSQGENISRERIIHERIINHQETPSHEVLSSTHRLTQEQIHTIALDLSPDADDEVMLELRRVMEKNGIHNALSVLKKLNSPHLEDDFHRFLVAYILAGMPVVGWKKEDAPLKALHMSLYEVILPEPEASTLQKDRGQGLKELLSIMEQFYAGMLALEPAYAGEPAHMSLELAIPEDNPELRFYVSVPNGKKDLFEKQLLSILPDAHLNLVKDDYNVFAQDGTTAASYATLKEPPMISLREYTDFDYDPLNTILNAFAKIQATGEGAAFQIIFKPRKDIYTKHYREILKELKKGESKKRAFSLPEDAVGKFLRDATDTVFDIQTKSGEGDDLAIAGVEKKIQTPIVSANIRLTVSSRDAMRAEHSLAELEASFNQFQNTLGNSIVWKRIKGSNVKTFTELFSYRLFSQNANIPLSLRELATLYHFPPKGIRSSTQLKQARFATAPAPTVISSSGITLGINRFRGTDTAVRLAPEDRLRHLYVIGQTGTGKSGFLQTLIMQDMQNGEGLCFIDPHGKDVLDILSMVPPHRYEDVIYFDPAYIERPFGLNMLEYDPQYPEQKTFIVNELLAIFRQLYGDVPESMGPAFEQYFRNATQLVMEDPETGSTMLDISRVLSDDEFREKKLEKSMNPVVNQFWEKIATKAGGEASLENIVPYITNKFDDFTANDFMRPIIGQQESSFNFRQLMDERKILLVNLSKGRLGEKNANLLGLILVGKFFLAALSRANSYGQTLPPFYLYIDEFQNITTKSIPSILSEARKYKLSLTLAHQFLKQIDDPIRDAVFGNVGSMCAFRIGEEDAQVFEKLFAPAFSALDFANIENRNAYVRMLAQGIPQKPFSLKTLDLPAGNIAQVDDLRELSYLTYGRDRMTVENNIKSKYFGV